MCCCRRGRMSEWGILKVIIVIFVIFLIVIFYQENQGAHNPMAGFSYKSVELRRVGVENNSISDAEETDMLTVQENIIKPTLPYEREGKKLISIYTTWYGHSSWISEKLVGDSYFTVDSEDFICPKKCLYTYERALVSFADLVLSSIVDLRREKVIEIPVMRPLNQIWVAFVCESPINVDVSYYLRENNDRFNWSASYRRDSDIYWPSGHFYKRKRPLEGWEMTPTLEMVKKKKKFAAWIVSSCNSAGRREEIVRHLLNTMSIDVYGACGTLACPAGKCSRQTISADYKFYLSFENSMCLDYVTEKFYDALASDMIPVTYGGGDYGKLAPPHSFINMLDFNSTSELVNYLKYLDENPEEYLKYFEWKKEYGVRNVPVRAGLCNACVKLHEKEKKTKIIRDFSEWWTSPPLNESFQFGNRTMEDFVCVGPEELGYK